MNQTTNQIGTNNAGRDINQQQDPGPASFQMPEVLKDELTLQAEAVLAKLESLVNYRRILAHEIESYQAKFITAVDLQETLSFITKKVQGL